MANYATLKAAIQQVVKTNGNNEITGALLQQSLIAMINALGVDYQFAGVATSTTVPGTPDQNVFYIGAPGTYPNFAGTVVEDGYIGIFMYSGSWLYESVQVGKNYDEDIARIFEILGDVGGGLIDVTSQFEIVNGQAYGNVGSAISTNNDQLFSRVRIANTNRQFVVIFKTRSGSGSDVSSYIQFVNSSNVIVRRLYVSGSYDNGVTYTEELQFQESESAVYVSGEHGSIKIKERTGDTRTLSERLEDLENNTVEIVDNLTEGGSDKALSAQQGVVIGEQIFRRRGGIVTSQREFLPIPFDGQQAYGNVGSSIRFAQLAGYSFVKIFVSGLEVRFGTGSNNSISSRIQYVDSNDIVIARDAESVTTNTTIEKTLTFPSGAAAVLVTFATGSLELDVDLLDYESQGNKLVKADSSAVGFEVAFVDSSDALAIKVDVEGVATLQYPTFATTQQRGTVVCDSENIVLAAYYASSVGYNTIQISDFPTAKYVYISLYPKSGRVYDFSIGAPGWVQPGILSDDYLQNLDYKGLSLKGARALRSEIFNSSIGGERPFFPFCDFGVMPSCLLSEPPCFLGDGLISSAEAIIKYSDVVAKYDSLVSTYPGYVTKTALGYDASRTIMIYSYTFEPKYWKQSVYLQAGVHGWEPEAIYALGEIMYLISNAYSPESSLYVNEPSLRWLRQNVKFTVVPCVNPWGFNNRGDCGMDKRQIASNNYNGIQLNGSWNSNQPENVYVRQIMTALKDELAFTIDMHTTVWPDSRTRYGCFYGGYNSGAINVMTLIRNWQALYSFYNVKYPSIVQGDNAPNPLGGQYASIGTMSNVFSSWSLLNFGVQSATIEFSDHVWTEELHTSIALSVAVNMYLNHIIGQICDVYKFGGLKELPAGDIYLAKG